MRSVQAYHGTSVVNGRKIKRTGFKAWTYFAFDQRYAFDFGGSVVFAARFNLRGFRGSKENGNWQFMIRTKIERERISESQLFRRRPLKQPRRTR